MYDIISGGEYKLGIIYFLILLLFYINYHNFSNPTIEGLDLIGEVKEVAGKVSSIASTAGALPGQITGITTKITGAVTDIANTVATKVKEAEKRVEDKIRGIIDTAIGGVMKIVNDAISEIKLIQGKIIWIIDQIKDVPFMIIRKITKFIDNLKTLVTDGIISPFLTLFYAIGNLFEQIGAIAMKVIDKIKSLPDCASLYAYESTSMTAGKLYRNMLPNYLKGFISTIYTYTLMVIKMVFTAPWELFSNLIGLPHRADGSVPTPWDLLLEYSGIDKQWDTCFNFSVDPEINSIRAGFNKVGPDFRSKFGHMNFNDLIKGL